MQFLTSTPTYKHDIPAVTTWGRLRPIFEDSEGLAYYKYPVFAVVNPKPPDLAVVARDFEPFVAVIVSSPFEELTDTSVSTWKLGGNIIDSPILELGDHVEGLRRRLAVSRDLRTTFAPYGILVLSLVSRVQLTTQLRDIAEQCTNLGLEILAMDDEPRSIIRSLKKPVEDRAWALTLSVLQNVAPLNKPNPELGETSNRVGGAIRNLEREIAILDSEQHKVAVETAPGPQRIRGLAGTGKTVVLALKAANLHLQYPEARILFTFFTQSLYNQITELIRRFYRPYADAEPNWNALQVKHGWGSSKRPGVYYDICAERGALPLTLDGARRIDRALPFRACCKHALEVGVQPYYDYILVDEAQDFPFEFFHVLLERATKDKRIYFAYDELQNLSALETPTTADMFGYDGENKPRVDLTGEYDSDIEKDFVLHKSYRCPRQNLVLAHGIGLAIKDETSACVQMIDNASSWESFGYEILEGSLRVGERTVINRPEANSPNRIGEIYTGALDLIRVRVAPDRESEIQLVAESIALLIEVEGVKPEQIIVTALPYYFKKAFIELQNALQDRNVDSTIPGLVEESWAFGQRGKVTLSTLRRAKGNEAPVVFIMAFESLYDYVDPIENRNKAFTAISRSKGWLRISGVGPQMERAKREIDAILADDGKLCFTFPDMDNLHIRRLDASDTSRRRRELALAKRSAQQLAGVDPEALATLDPAILRELKRRFDEATGGLG
jgi:superfamily I DNA and RNA helicase